MVSDDNRIDGEKIDASRSFRKITSHNEIVFER